MCSHKCAGCGLYMAGQRLQLVSILLRLRCVRVVGVACARFGCAESWGNVAWAPCRQPTACLSMSGSFCFGSILQLFLACRALTFVSLVCCVCLCVSCRWLAGRRFQTELAICLRSCVRSWAGWTACASITRELWKHCRSPPLMKQPSPPIASTLLTRSVGTFLQPRAVLWLS